MGNDLSIPLSIEVYDKIWEMIDKDNTEQIKSKFQLKNFLNELYYQAHIKINIKEVTKKISSDNNLEYPINKQYMQQILIDIVDKRKLSNSFKLKRTVTEQEKVEIINGEEEIVPKPFTLNIDRNKEEIITREILHKVPCISSRSNTSYGLNSKGEVLFWGSDINSQHIAYEPTIVKGLEKIKVIALSCFESEAVFITDDNKVYSNYKGNK
eukprot:TRINITY_DN5521_c0_g1_i2.p2 TRINITY_DN5521_c0_g1~~TRINITY_DN5521_c0_g1_i2.p2  ORF type:complete len:211 (+),score=42.20 TRINITY_DN5521_c0_g1_i2:3-635(+)